jgi:hypothetical protein
MLSPFCRLTEFQKIFAKSVFVFSSSCFADLQFWLSVPVFNVENLCAGPINQNEQACNIAL